MRRYHYAFIPLGFVLGVFLVWLLWPPVIVVSWETASEVDAVGFYIYRAESPAAPFAPLNETPIPAQGDPLTGASYRFEDHRVLWGQTYFYQLEELESNGNRRRYPKVVKARAGAGWAVALAAGALMAGLAWGILTLRFQKFDGHDEMSGIQG
ncbi:MAG: hypothetical protein DRI61_03630 [Chloroflexi bacterium]|nr:MAG: hypothetical protein DRI61_03630 [Chloroflexota bacterium]